MENETNSHLIWCSVAGTGKETDIAPFNELDIVPVNYSSAMANSIYQSSYLEERLQLWVDNLNLLYVAFTRACKNLIIWGKQNQKGTVSELLQEALLQMKDPPMQHEETDSEEDKSSAPDLYEYGTLCLSEPSAEQASGNRLSEQAAGIPVRLESTETAIEFQQSNRSADFIRGEEEEEDSTSISGREDCCTRFLLPSARNPTCPKPSAGSGSTVFWNRQNRKNRSPVWHNGP